MHTIVRQKVTQGYRKYYPSLDRLVFLSQTRKVNHPYFQTKGLSRSLAMAHLNRRHIIFYHRSTFVVYFVPFLRYANYITIQACDRQTDKQTNAAYAYVALPHTSR